MRIVFWQNMPAIHQCAHIRALAAHAGYEVTLVVQEEIDPARVSMGWTVPDFGKACLVNRPDKATINRLIAESPEESVHIFSRIRSYPMVKEAFLRCLQTPAQIGLYSEPWDFRGIKGARRLLFGKSDAVLFGKRLSFILATGSTGVDCFRRCGFSAEKVYPYGYFVDWPACAGSGRSDPGPLRLVFLGVLCPRKGVDLLFRALQGLTREEWRLTVIGEGESKASLTALAGNLGIAERIEFLPYLPNHESLAVVSQCDLLALPSRFDGWGAVVNEALMCGVPVVCSDRCGAADLLRASWRGEVFPAFSVSGLREALERRIAGGKRTDALTERIKSWAHCIEGESAANYLLSIIHSAAGSAPRPTPPWYDAFDRK